MTESNPLESHRRRWALGETLEYALAALEKALAK